MARTGRRPRYARGVCQDAVAGAVGQADRLIATVDVGTNSGNAWAQQFVPARS